jgi:predicted nuclease with TOPRIM domain
MDEIELKLTDTVSSYHAQIEELIASVAKTNITNQQRDEQLAEIQKIRDQLQNDLDAEHAEREIIMEELERLKAEKEEIKDLRTNNTKLCEEKNITGNLTTCDELSYSKQVRCLLTSLCAL